MIESMREREVIPGWVRFDELRKYEAAYRKHLLIEFATIRVPWPEIQHFEERFDNPALGKIFQEIGEDPECIQKWVDRDGNYVVKIAWLVQDAMDYHEANHRRRDVKVDGLCRCGCRMPRPIGNSMYYNRDHMFGFLGMT
jgi:hypothetical protein